MACQMWKHYVRIRGIERHVIDQAKAMHETRSAIVSFIPGHAAGLLRRPNLSVFTLASCSSVSYYNGKNMMEVCHARRDAFK